ncbi:hypothetical protein Hamer_G007421 [Homarus americanus]|uniref:Uncharacterized protein n=1 Tax=Homarus americanus TaxID=6706 RepID=A0A8J5JPQ0_HOMAM|nr:hypothetical protein Hamer_G007421 [Homarus americanus]
MRTIEEVDDPLEGPSGLQQQRRWAPALGSDSDFTCDGAALCAADAEEPPSVSYEPPMTRGASRTLATPSVPAQSLAEGRREERELESQRKRRQCQSADSQSKALARQHETEEEAVDRRLRNAALTTRAREHEAEEEAEDRRRKDAASTAQAREAERHARLRRELPQRSALFYDASAYTAPPN